VLERSRIPAIKIPIFDLLGGASYALYLIHPVAIALLMIGVEALDMDSANHLMTIVAISLAVNCALSILIYRRVEPKLKPQSNPSVRSDPKGAVLR
jgi:peptidoglycan/LPS O-acetylase OafA/YrhL